MVASTHLEFEDQATGSNNNTWGNINDDNLYIMEKAIARVLSVATTGGTTILTSDQNRYPIIIVTGVLTSNAVIQTRAAEKNWFFINQTSGNFTVTVKTASGTGVLCPRYRSTKVYCDGTNDVLARPHTIPMAIAAGTVNAITASFQPAFSINELQDGTMVLVEATGANSSGTVTFNPDTIGNYNVRKAGNQTLAVGDIPRAGYPMLLVYRLASTTWELINPETRTLAVDDAVTNTITTIATLRHTSSGTVAASFGARLSYDLENASGNVYTAAAFLDVLWSTPTAAAEAAVLGFGTAQAGASAYRFFMGAGFYSNGVTGGDKGAGSINIAGPFFIGGVDRTTTYDSGAQSITAGGAYGPLAHGLGAEPAIVDCRIECVTNEGGYSAGQSVRVHPTTDPFSDYGFTFIADSANWYCRFGAFGLRLLNFVTGVSFTITPANWRFRVRLRV